MTKCKIYIIVMLAMTAITMAMSCNGISVKRNIQDTIVEMRTNHLNLRLDRMALCIPDNDTARTDTADKPFRLIVYVDSTNCSPCVLNKMYQWNSLIDKTRANGNKVDYIFIFEPKAEQTEDAHLAAESSGLKSRIYLDTAHVFRELNKFVPEENKYHTMLINNNDSILLVGSPKNNKKIEDLFLAIINKPITNH